jgi:hypothetical protein
MRKPREVPFIVWNLARKSASLTDEQVVAMLTQAEGFIWPERTDRVCRQCGQPILKQEQKNA